MKTFTPVHWTERRREVMELILQGFGPTQISNLLGIKYRTATAHIEHVLHLAGCTSCRELQAREIERLRHLVGEAA
jgi:DNA-binding CsgD family transcriptional regulator